MSWASAVGSIFSSAANIYNAEKAWKHQKEYAQNAHQWEVQDLKKAGLNPILSAGGSGAPMTSAPVPNVENPFSEWSATKLAKKQADADISNKQSQTDANTATAKQANAMADSIAQQTGQEKQLFEYRKTEAMWNSKTAEQNFINAQKMPQVYDADIKQKHSAAGLSDSSNLRQRAELPFWQATGEVVHSAIDYFRQKYNEAQEFKKLQKEFQNSGYTKSHHEQFGGIYD